MIGVCLRTCWVQILWFWEGEREKEGRELWWGLASLYSSPHTARSAGSTVASVIIKRDWNCTKKFKPEEKQGSRIQLLPVIWSNYYRSCSSVSPGVPVCRTVLASSSLLSLSGSRLEPPSAAHIHCPLSCVTIPQRDPPTLCQVTVITFEYRRGKRVFLECSKMSDWELLWSSYETWPCSWCDSFASLSLMGVDVNG